MLGKNEIIKEGCVGERRGGRLILGYKEGTQRQDIWFSMLFGEKV